MSSYSQFLEDIVTTLGGKYLDWQRIYNILNEVEDDIYEKFLEEFKYVCIWEIDPVKLVYEIVKEEVLNEIEEKIEENLEEIIEMKRKRNDFSYMDTQKEIIDKFKNAKKEIYVYGNYKDTCYDRSSELKKFLEEIQLEKITNLSQTSRWFISQL